MKYNTYLFIYKNFCIQLLAKYKEMKEKLEMDKINLQERRRQAEKGGRPGTPEKKGRKFFK